MSDDSPSPLSGNGAVLYQLGKVEGKLDAVLSGQSAQAEVNAQNNREHDEFRNKLGDHASTLAVLSDNKKTAESVTLTRPQKIALWIAAPSGIASLAVLITRIILTTK